MKHTIAVYDPGHFHAALLFSKSSPRVDPVIHVYAPPGRDVEDFADLINGFNRRDIDPTNWRLERHIGGDALEGLIAERPGEIVILAGKNGLRLPIMHRLHDQGFHVLADKPWLTDNVHLPHLEAITERAPTTNAPLAVDIMTGRFSTLARLRNLVIATPSVFGALDGGSLPALEFTSTHHLLKLVNGQPLQRPTWFYDSNMQGDGLVDIQSHYVDQAQWIVEWGIVGPGHHFDIDRDFEILSAERWALPVPLDLFKESTGAETFPEYLAPVVRENCLHLANNGRIDYRLCGIHVRQHCAWDLREAPGGSDIHGFTARGEKAVLTIQTNPETSFRPRMFLSLDGARDIEPALRQWRTEFPDLEATAKAGGYELKLPPDTGHEGQFPLMLDQFLDLVETDSWPIELMARIRTRYSLLARARNHVR
jgi:predicted dehydrogenase